MSSTNLCLQRFTSGVGPRGLVFALTTALTTLLAIGGSGSAALAQCPPGWAPGVPGFAGGVSNFANCITILPSGAIAVGSPSTGIPPVSGVTLLNTITFAILVLPNGDTLVGGDLAYRILPISTNRWGFIRISPAGVASPWTSGMSGGAIVYAMAALPDGDVIVAGSFTSVEGVTTSNITRYNPATSAWSALGGGVNGVVRALAVLPSGDVLVGGQFSTADGLPAAGIAQYNPATNTWAAIGSGVTYFGGAGLVRSLLVLPDGDVLIGGRFDTAGGTPANSIARFSPATGVWSAFGTGMNSAVNCIEVLADGDIVAGGDFTIAGDVPVNRIARYRPSTGAWSALGLGVNRTSGGVPTVNALKLLPPGRELAIGGSFTTAGGVAVNNLVRYIEVIPDPTINTQPSDVTATPSGNALFLAEATGWSTTNYSTGIPNFQWRKDGVPISAASNPTATTQLLRLTNVQASDLGSYDCVATNPCGGTGTVSNAANLSFVGNPCPADFNADGAVDFFDYLDFVGAFSSGC